MKKFLIASIAAVACYAGPVLAADMPTRAPVYKAAPAAMFDWSGFYIGGQIGYAWGRADLHDLTTSTDVRYDTNGVIGGGHFGYNWQSGTTVFGFETDFNATGVKGDDGGAFGAVDTTKIRDAASLRARLGYAANDTLWYLTAGYAAADVRHSRLGSSQSNWMSGWTAGAGVSKALTLQWIASLEYRYTDYGNQHFQPTVDLLNVDLRTHELTARLTYKFGDPAWGKGPVSARY